ncbi:MAG: glycoside hydrolase family 88 protein [Kiritimatiellae bacterium]|nr:glycoside hydrolase family 88 protein [Kiritimatiellia bacterium]
MMNYLEIAIRAYNKHREDGAYHRAFVPFFNMDNAPELPGPAPLNNYPWIVTLHGLTRYACTTQSEEDFDFVRSELMPYVKEEIEFTNCNFKNYICGGNATAFMFMEGRLPEAMDVVRKYADELLYDAPRSKEGIYGKRQPDQLEKIWIDVAFAVCPFLLFAGLGLGEDKYIEESCQQMIKMYDILFDENTSLLHQARGFINDDFITEDCWSRGNGWAMYALTELANYLPADYPLRPQIEKMYKTLVDVCIKYQDNYGMWHQEMTCKESFPETSGTCLIAYGIGVGIEKGLLDQSYKEYFDRTVEGMQTYMSLDGSVFNCCKGCLAPPPGTKEAYIDKEWGLNDVHAFGTVMLLMIQAERLNRA